MKALITFSLLCEVDNPDEAHALALACRQAAWMNAVQQIESRGATNADLGDIMTLFEPAVGFPISLETA